ncbi:MAG: hypothetical protein WBM83_02330 [Flavobacteriaceae bacterium]
MKKSRILVWALCIGSLMACSKKDSETEKEVPIDKSANLLSTGDSATEILSNNKFDKMIVEIAFVTGFKPTQEAMTAFIEFLQKHTFKQQIELVYKELSSPGEETLTLQEIADLETDNRTAYTNGTTIAIYIYFADAPSDDDDDEEGLVTLGAVYRNTSMIIHENTIRNLASQSPLISNAAVETATLNHEFGHLFGLVDLGSPMVNEHEDVDGTNHCDQEGCLMRAELQFGGLTNKNNALATKDDGQVFSTCSLTGTQVLKMLEQATSKGISMAPGIDAECLLDLQANGGK